MQVLGLISSPADPASRVRIMQYIAPLEKENIQLSAKYFKPLKEKNPGSVARFLKKSTGINEWRSTDLVKSIGRIPLLFNQSAYELIWQNRLLQVKHSFWEKKLRKPVIFDIDDAIWLNEGMEQVHDKFKRSQMIFAGNDYLADYASRFNPRVERIPSTIDTDRLFPLPNESASFIIGWIGTSGNLRYLEPLMPALKEFCMQYKDARLMVVSDMAPSFFPANDPQYIFRKWEASSENELINEFSVGLMPMPDDEWTRGKCGYKLLQYLACGKPAVASPVGVNREILSISNAGIAAENNADWFEALKQLRQSALRNKMGTDGRAFILKNYDHKMWAGKISLIMKSLV